MHIDKVRKFTFKKTKWKYLVVKDHGVTTLFSNCFEIIICVYLGTYMQTYTGRQKENDKTNEAKGKQLVIQEKKSNSVIKFPVFF